MGGMIGQTFALQGSGRLRAHDARRHHAHAAAGGAQAVGGAHPHRRVEGHGSRSSSRRWSAGSPSRSASQPGRSKQIADADRWRRRWRATSAAAAPSSKLNTTARLKEIKLPMLAIAGEQDAAAPGTRVHRRERAGREARAASRRPRTSPTSSSPRRSIALCGSSFHPLPARELRRSGCRRGRARAPRVCATRSSSDLRPRVERRHRREHDRRPSRSPPPCCAGARG